MRPFLAALATAVAGFGGGVAVFGGYDDSPGGTLLGALVVLAAMVFNARGVLRSQQAS